MASAPDGALADLVDRVRNASFGEAAVAEGASVVVGVSGGPDSVALLHLLRLARPDLHLLAAHVRHGLRDDSEDAAAAAASAATLGVPFVERSVTVEEGSGPEDSARRARWGALAREAQRVGATAVAVGHTMDDQAETVLLRIARGTGIGGLGGMAPTSPLPVAPGADAADHAGQVVVIRPLLGERREVVRQAAAGYRTVADPTNADADQRRARARAEALPALRRLHPSEADVVPLLARLAGFARAGSGAGREWSPERPEEQAAVSRFGCAVDLTTTRDRPLHEDDDALRIAWRLLPDGPVWPGPGVLTRLGRLGPGERCDLPSGVRATRVGRVTAPVTDRVVLCPVDRLWLPRLSVPRDQDVLVPGFGLLRWTVVGAWGASDQLPAGPDPVAWSAWNWQIELPVAGTVLAVRGRRAEGERSLRRVLQRYPEPLRGQVPLLVDDADRVVMAGPVPLRPPGRPADHRIRVVASPG
ncbi:tRNA lysidine(34) synthetase TilS [Euzebya tangerina]|uniref:tRNA lysidine(34) synthetase TilS n=1 Tax=Euzebya tangerina TaxID=591198 RepID=UPI000E31B11B|nr:tRNA lysidine(34) synthetase TilS [Euzebya tangerina]